MIKIAKFKYKNKTYIYYLESGSKVIHYGILDNGVKEINEPLIISFMEDVLTKTLISPDFENHIFLKNMKYKNNEYRIVFDSVSNLKYVVPYNGSDTKYVNELNYLNNYLVSAIRNSKCKIPISKNLRRYIKTAVGTIMVVVDVSLLLLLASGYSKTTSSYTVELDNAITIEEAFDRFSYADSADIISDEDEGILVDDEKEIITPPPIVYVNPEKDKERIKYIEEVELYEATPAEKVFAAVDCNPFLSDREKKFIKQVPDFFNDFYRDDTIETMMNRFYNLSMSYELELNSKYGDATGMDAFYDSWNNRIVDLYAASFKEANKDKIAHELCHVYSTTEHTLGNGLYEACNELVSNEYFMDINETALVYDRECGILRMLMEIIGSEPVKVYYQTGDVKQIVRALTKLDRDASKAYMLLQAFDEVSAQITNEEEQTKCCDTVYRIFGYYYNLRFGRKMEDDLTMMVNYSAFNSEFQFEYEGKQISHVIDVQKGYFYDKAMEAHPTTTFKYIDYDNTSYIDMTVDEAFASGLIYRYADDKGIAYVPRMGLVIKDNRVKGTLEFEIKSGAVEKKDSNKITK